MPSLAAAIGELHTLGLHPVIELKCGPGEASAAAGALVREIGRAWRAADPPLISSFDPDALAAVRKARADLPVAVVAPDLSGGWRAACRALGTARLHVGDGGADGGGLAAGRLLPLIAEGIEIGVYTVNDPARARELLSWGVAGIFTDCPRAIAAAL